MNAIYALQKSGERILDAEGTYFVNSTGFGAIERKRVEKLASLGICRIDRVGESTFAVFLRMP